MRILIFGAGNIGCLYAARLATASHDVSILARGTRFEQISKQGVQLEEASSGQRTNTLLPVVSHLKPDDAYDLVVVVLPRHRVSEVLPALAANKNTPNVMFFGNNAAGTNELTDALGHERVLLGFPGAAAIREGDLIKYVITSAREQPTTMGELDGEKSGRVRAITAAFKGAGFPVAICSDMDAWLKTHVAKILPTVAALYRERGDLERLAAADSSLRLMVRAIREGFRVVRANGVPIVPSNHRVFEWLPEAALVSAMRHLIKGKTTPIKFGHATQGRAEWQFLAEEFEGLIQRANVSTPAIHVLTRQLKPASAALSEQIHRSIEDRLLHAGVPGCALAFVAPGLPARSLQFGMADLSTARAVDGATRFPLFSGTKLYTAAALMLLVERGKLDLDASVLDYLPELPLRRPITVRQLASHSSGLPDTRSAFLALHTPDEPQPSAAEALSAYRLGGRGTPGKDAQYGNVNYAILGALIERISEQPYEEFVRDALVAPLRADIDFGHSPAHTRNAAVGYLPRLDPLRLLLSLRFPDVARRIYAEQVSGMIALRRYSLDTAAIGGLVGTARGFIPLLQEMLSEQDGLLRAETKREMLTPHSHGAAGIASTDGVGIGWKHGSVKGAEFWNHEGGGAGFCSETRLYPADGIGVVILMNRSQTSALSRLAHEICELTRQQVIGEQIHPSEQPGKATLGQLPSQLEDSRRCGLGL